jgi:lipid II isoglutaminyl synthase (glutamine-hydrolysing)
VIGGRVLMALAPAAPAALSRDRVVTLVSGTNGKTTTTALTVAVLGTSSGSNRDGANTAAGVAGALTTCDQRRMVLEVDEAWLPWAVEVTRPHSVVLTNLTRDQLSRHHEVGAIAAAWRRGLAGVPVVVANADDPAVVWAALAARHQIWVSAGERWVADSLVCPACGAACRRQGEGWACLACTLRRPQPDWWLEGDDVVGHHGRVPLQLALPGAFNRGNAAMALAAAQVTDAVAPDAGAGRLAEVPSVSGRYEQVQVGAHEVRLMLAKNPAGWLELLDLLSAGDRPVVLLFNAEGVDGRDPSWLYDVSFESLRGRDVRVQGRRATDLLVRLRYDGVTAQAVPGPLAAALATVPAGPVEVIGNYSAFRSALTELHHG